MGDTGQKRVHLAVAAVQSGHVIGQPIGGQPPPRSAQMAENLAQQPGVVVGHHLAEVGHLTDVP